MEATSEFASTVVVCQLLSHNTVVEPLKHATYLVHAFLGLHFLKPQ